MTGDHRKHAPDTKAQAATRAANAGPIDFQLMKTADQLAAERGASRSPWVRRLEDLLAGVVAGRGEVDVFYRIGQFTTKTGARTAINTLAKRDLPGEFLLESRVVGRGDKKGSELWAAVPSDAQVYVGDGDVPGEAA